MIQFDEHMFQMGWFNHQPERGPLGCYPHWYLDVGPKTLGDSRWISRRMPHQSWIHPPDRNRLVLPILCSRKGFRKAHFSGFFPGTGLWIKWMKKTTGSYTTLNFGKLMNIWWTYDKHDMYEMMISMLRVLFILLTIGSICGEWFGKGHVGFWMKWWYSFLWMRSCELCFWSWFLHPSWLLGALGTCILRAREVNPSSWLQHPSSLFSQDTKSTGFQKFASTHSKGSTTRFVASSWWNVDGEVLTKKTLKQGWNNSKNLNISAHLGPQISGNQPSSLQPGRGRTFTDSASDVSDTWRIDLGLVNNVGQQPNDWIDSPRRYGWWPKSG